MKFHDAEWLNEFEKKSKNLGKAIDEMGIFLTENPPDDKRATDEMHRALKTTGNTLIEFSQKMIKKWF